MDFCRGKAAGCRCRRCADEGLTLKDAAIGVGAAVSAVALIGWGISSLFSTGSSSSSSRTTTTTSDDDGKRELMVGIGATQQGGYSSGSKGAAAYPWERPAPKEIFMINCDGSLVTEKIWDGSFKKTAGYYGALIRDSRGEVIAAAAGRSREPVDITIHELQGLEIGLKLAGTYNGIERISVGTDSQTVVYQYDLLKRWPQAKLPSDATRDIWDRIIGMIDQLEHFQIKHIDRKKNRAADVLADLRPDSEYEEIDPSDFSDKLQKIIVEDKSSKHYII
ncbi:hypothetical protein BVC80_1215g6 [Macleaya cordata]|uniref:RNase H type-1 domain-containing protein n=1 Tax=Macleaya cordata TaxID=56857 RepID=A0A200Q346_MACCD|nr:hypothetical protein BVC80_1215g6 [Macleaya cordata]